MCPADSIIAGMRSIRAAKFTAEENDAALCRELMREYALHLNASVGSRHICVEALENELAALPGSYGEPAGAVLLAFVGEQPAGCVALQPLKANRPADPTERACEMKRLWIRPAHQATGLGRALAEAVMDAARERGYTAMYLDTLPASMQAAHRLYLSLGFRPVERYNQNPVLRSTAAHTDTPQIAFLRRNL